jgi:acetyltransferase-like isoleucine patch superfamily enzyme
MVRYRDPRQVPLRSFLSPSSIRWVVRHRAWTPYHLVRYWRFLLLRLRHPDVVTEGMVYLGRRVELRARRGYGRIVLGRWVHLGNGTRLRAHEGTLRIGDKTVFGGDSTINCYLDLEIGPRCLVADWVYMCDFDHRTADLHLPIKDQGIVKTPVRIGADSWVGVKASVLRGADVGRGSVLAAHTVVRGTVAPYSVVAGVPGRVVRDRVAAYEAAAAERAALADMARKAAESAPSRPGVTGAGRSGR